MVSLYFDNTRVDVWNLHSNLGIGLYSGYY
jgi:hypothetical protein